MRPSYGNLGKVKLLGCVRALLYCVDLSHDCDCDPNHYIDRDTDDAGADDYD